MLTTLEHYLPALNSLRSRFLSLNIFSKGNVLKLNVQKCGIVYFGLATPSPHQESVNSHIPTKTAAKCLGYWWSRDLLSNLSVEENIKEGQRMYFFKYCTLRSHSRATSTLSLRNL